MRLVYTNRAKQDLISIKKYFSEVAPLKTNEILVEILERVSQLESVKLISGETG